MENKNSILDKMSSKNIAFVGLVVIFFVLLFQLAASLFFAVPFEEISQIDIVFRTAISSIFGYIMSMVSSTDFTMNRKKGKQNTVKTNKKTIGFNAKDENTPQMIYNNAGSIEDNDIIEIIDMDVKEEKISTASTFRVNVQIIVLTVACIFCLIILLVARNFSHLIVNSSSTTVTFSMFRDIISGSIGALIGLSKSNV